jgi:hypothetical protein
MKYIITESQHQKLLMENISMYLRRRLNFDDMKDEIDSIIEYHLIPCEFKDAHSFVTEVCDMFTYDKVEDLQVSAKDTDSLYYYVVDVFGKYLTKFYNKKCGNKNMVTESKDSFNRKVKILKRYTEESLSEKPWFDGLDIKISSYQTSHKNKNGVYHLVSIPLLRFKINTKGLPKSISTNDVDKLEDLISDIVFPLFNSVFPDDENENPEALWDTKFDFHL